MNSLGADEGRFARFEIGAALGEGGFGVVVQAFDRELGIDVAVKRLARTDPASLFRFKQEFRALADLSHPNLVKLHELFCLGDDWYFSMDLVPGVDFTRYVRGAEHEVSALASTRDERPGVRELRAPGDAPAPAAEGAEERLRRVLPRLAAGLAALHQARLLHRDLKPSNVLVTPAGRLTILDFGLVTPDGGDPEQRLEPRIVGTPGYMAPEQMAGEPVGAAADWYAVGVMLYEALVGRAPFIGTIDGIRAAQLAGPPDPGRERPDAPEDLALLCRRLLAPRPADRPTGSEVLAALGVRAEDAVPLGTSRSPAFVGRAAELAILRQALADTGRGRPAVVLVQGPAGTGKTTLVTRFLDELRTGGAAVLSGKCHERETLPFNAVDGFVDSLTQHLRAMPAADAATLMPRDPHALARLFPVFGRLPVVAAQPRRQAADNPQEQRRRAFAALRELLARLADRQPVVIFLDDLQWGDADSLALLGELLVEPDPPALLMVLAYRREDRDVTPQLGALRQRLHRLPRTTRDLTLGDLSADDAGALVRALLGDDVSEALATTLIAESGGRPLILEEMARVGQDLDTTATSLDKLIDARLAVLSLPARRVLDLLAAAGHPLDLAVARRAAVLAPTETQAALEELRSRRLVRSNASAIGTVLEPLHDRVRDAVLRLQSPKTTRSCHLAIAAALIVLERADARTIAMHLRLAGEPARARPYLIEAAAQAAESLAFDRAGALYAEALTDATGEERTRLQLALAQVLSMAGRGAEAAAIYAEAAHSVAPHERVDLERRVAEQLLRSGNLDEGLVAVRKVLALAGMRLPGSPRRALASFLAERARLRLRGRRFRERAAADIAPETLARIDVCWTVGTALAASDLVRGGDFQTRHLRLALAAGEPSRIARGLALEAVTAAIDGTHGQARAARIVPEARALAERVGNPHAIGWARAAGAVLAWTEARWRDAVELATQSLAVFQTHCIDSAWEVGAVDIWFRLRPLLALGEIERFVEGVALSLADAEERQDRFALTLGKTIALPWVHLVSDRPDDARAESAAAIAGWSSAGWFFQHQEDLRAQSFADIYQGRAEAALARIDAAWPEIERAMHLRIQNERIQMGHVRGLAILSLARAGAGRHEREVAWVERTARALRREKNRWADAVGAGLEAGVAAARRTPTAPELYAHAAACYEELGMVLHAAAARRRRGELMPSHQGAGEIAAADAALTARGVVDPERFARVLVA